MNEEDFVGFEFEPLEVEKEEKEKDCEPPKECKKKENILKIIPFPTNKKDIEQRPFMKEDIIPRHSSSVIFNGRSGSGKSNLLINLLSRPEFYGRTKPKDEKSQYFDLIFLFSPTAAGGDDLVRFLKIPEKRVFTQMDTKILDNILKTQKDLIAEKGLEKSPKILIIFEDIQSNNGRIMNSPSFLKCFIQARHLNVSTFLLGQSWTRTPRACRLQANNIFFFPSSGSEVELLVKEFCPPHTDKKTFQKLVEHATKEQYNFLSINMRCPPEKRFRKNLDTILKIKN
jgi:hypothetical protein